MVLRQPFTTTSQTLVNYDFTDILSDLGYVTVFGMIDLANNETLVRPTIESDDPKISFSTGGGGSLRGESNFDFEFRLEKRLDGLCYVSILYFARAIGNEDATCLVKVRLIHVDTSNTEVEIGAQQVSSTVTETASAATAWNTAVFSFDINQAFSKGEKLRLEVQVHSGDPGNTDVGFYADPADRDFEQVGQLGSFTTTIIPSSQLKVLMPFPLEL